MANFLARVRLYPRDLRVGSYLTLHQFNPKNPADPRGLRRSTAPIRIPVSLFTKIRLDSGRPEVMY
jgi:hypothetical protein